MLVLKRVSDIGCINRRILLREPLKPYFVEEKEHLLFSWCPFGATVIESLTSTSFYICERIFQRNKISVVCSRTYFIIWLLSIDFILVDMSHFWKLTLTEKTFRTQDIYKRRMGHWYFLDSVISMLSWIEWETLRLSQRRTKVNRWYFLVV